MLKVGDKAPAFKLKDQNGTLHQLKDYKGKKLVIYFYPRDNTPTCSVENCNLRDNNAYFKSNDIAVIGVSTDSEKSHKKFETKYQLPYPLLADEEQQMVTDYGVWGLKKFMGREFMGTKRCTFLIDGKGIIVAIIDKVKSKDHAQQIINFWQ